VPALVRLSGSVLQPGVVEIDLVVTVFIDVVVTS
jgi:hypothetical protein